MRLSKFYGFIFFGFLFSWLLTPLSADEPQKSEDKKEDTEYVEEDVYVEPVEGDIWFGPGFYYGIWFSEEQEYWYWRDQHRDYPPNRNYYNHDHPVEYHPQDHEGHYQEEHREDVHEDGGRHGGGGRK